MDHMYRHFKSHSEVFLGFKKSQKGFTLIEMVVGLAIGVIGILLFSSSVLSLLNSADFIQGSATRDELSMMIRRTIVDRRAIKKTIDQNPVMRAVLKDEYIAPFATVNSNQNYGIKIYDSSGLMKIAGADADLINPIADPVYYTTEGAPCTTPGTGKCVISVVANFMIQGMPKYDAANNTNNNNNVIPIQVYPLWDLRMKPEFMLISYRIEFLITNGIERKPIEGSVFLGLDDLGN